MRIARLALLAAPLPFLMGAQPQGCGTPPPPDAGNPGLVPQPIVPAEPEPAPVTAAEMHDMAALCDADHQTGTTGPRAVCSTAAPCPGSVTSGSSPPACPGGQMLVAWQDSVVDPSNVPAAPDARYACAPIAAPAVNPEPVPLIVFFTPSFTSAETIYSQSQLDDKAPTWVWPYATPSGQPATGYVLLVAQERNLQLGALGAGMHEDEGYRPLDPALNPDIRNADALIDWAVQYYGARIDRRRIYVSGWSNGAIFGQYYAIVRHPSTQLAVAGSRWGQPTPGGNHVAAAAVFSGDDPFAGLPSGDCGMRVYPTTRVPIYLSHRACDLVPCEETQQECQFAIASRSYQDTTGASTDLTVEYWLAQELTATSGWHAMGDSATQDVVLDGGSNHLPPGPGSCNLSSGGPNDGTHCNAYPTWIPTPAGDPMPDGVTSTPTANSGCTPSLQILLHVLWPTPDEPSMLQFLAGATASPAS